MAVTEMRRFAVRLPNLMEIDPSGVRLEFDRPSDTLYVDFGGAARPAISVVLGDHLAASVDPETEEVVGLQIDGFLAHAVYEMPALLGVAHLIGLKPKEVERIRERIDPVASKRALLESFSGQMAPLARSTG